jgi:NAD(P)-dependent dehydrogenase (short-subunit alcohol dehydrogenase family)
MDTFGKIDLLVNNAGVAPKERLDLLNMTEESLDYVLDINLKGTLFLTQLVANQMIYTIKSGKTDNPRIINISSISAYTASINRGEYCIAKAGVGMLTKLFADRLAEYGILVYEIRPGIIATDMTSTVKDKYDDLIDNGLTPIKRWGMPEDVANAVSALCSNNFLFSTGEVINVDGGFHIRRL